MIAWSNAAASALDARGDAKRHRLVAPSLPHEASSLEVWSYIEWLCDQVAVSELAERKTEEVTEDGASQEDRISSGLVLGSGALEWATGRGVVAWERAAWKKLRATLDVHETRLKTQSSGEEEKDSGPGYGWRLLLSLGNSVLTRFAERMEKRFPSSA